jgi:hypothetical protein
MHKNYFKASYLGEFYEDHSAIAAIRLSVDSINDVCESAWGTKLFSRPIPDEPHYNLSPFMRPTRVDYLSFAHELDKLISENINVRFFDGTVQGYSITSHADGTQERKPKGTLSLLDEWLFSGEINWHGKIKEARKQILQPLRRIRRERQPAAHATIKNEYDLKYTALRREVLGDAAFALGNIALVLRTHPRVPQTKFPEWFEQGTIETI